MAKIHCPVHEDSTPSMEIYEEFGHCFSCGAHIPLKELNLEKQATKKEKKTENIQETIKWIKCLDTSRVRGLTLPVSNGSYYILWPDETYYKVRQSNQKVRYLGPQGIKPPLFWIRSKCTSDTLVCIEGELNLLSLKEALGEPTFDLASPGAASNFPNYIGVYHTYAQVILVLDNDPAGIAFGVYTKELLLKSGKSVTLILTDRDFNQVLQDDGPEGLKRYWEDLVK